MDTALEAYEGGCHCGLVRYVVKTRSRKVIDCNCSICRPSGYLHLIVPRGDFTLVRGAEALSEYRFNQQVARHLFCSSCGIKSFYYPRSHPEGVSINLRCLDGVEPEHFTIVPFDGRNWEANVAQIREPEN